VVWGRGEYVTEDNSVDMEFRVFCTGGQRDAYQQQQQLIQGFSTSYFHLPLAAVEAASWPQAVVVEAVQQTSILSFERKCGW